MGHTYAVLGLGRQGLAAVYDLLRNCEADAVVAFDPDADQRDEAARRMRELLGGGVSLAIEDSRGDAWVESAKSADVVVSCAPYRFNPDITRACVEAGLPLCDLGGNPDVVAEQERIADGRGVAVVPECGLAPGIANVAAVHLAKQHGADTVRVRCGGLPAVAPDPEINPLRYKLTFDPQGLISEYSGQCPALEDGKVIYHDACGTAETFDDDHECFPTSNNSLPVVKYLADCGVRRFDYRTIRYNGHLACVHGWKALGYLCGNKDRDLQLRELLAGSDALRYDRQKDRDKVILAVRGSRSDGGSARSWEYRIDVIADARTGFNAMELTTSWGATIVAHHIASGCGAPVGFATPERFVNTEWFLAEVDRRIGQLGQ